MRITRTTLGNLLLISAVACSSDRGPTVPSGPALVSLNAGSGVRSTVTGGGIVDFSAAGVGNGHFSFTGIIRGDGSVHGRFHQRRETPLGLVDFTGEVTCLTIDAARGRARFGGRITKNNSTHPGFLTGNHEIGDDVWFRVQDGGEGADSQDASTSYGFKPTLVDTSEQYCALPFDGLPAWNPASTFPLLAGNIQIRP